MSKRANGEGTWSIKKVNGNTYHMYRATIDGVQKSFYGKTKKEALEKCKKYQSSIKIEYNEQDVSFYYYTHNWLFNCKKNKVKERTFDYYDFITEKFIRYTKLGTMRVKQLNMMSNKDIHRLFEEHLVSYSDKSKSTVDGIYTVLNQVCKYGYTYHDFARNFMDGVDKLSEKEVKTKKKNIEALTYDDVMKLWNEMLRKNEDGNVINNSVGTYVYGIGAYALLFCCFTGLRWGEISSLQWKDIQKDGDTYFFKVDKQYITIKDRDEKSDAKTKTILADPKSEKSNRYIPLSSKALEILVLIKERFPQYYKPKHLIFSTTDNPYSASTANRLLKTMCKRAGVPIISPHVLRHSFASILLNEDEKNLYTVSDLLGHSSTDVTYKKYIDIFEKNKINAVKIFDGLSQ